MQHSRLPPGNGFVSEWLLLQGLTHSLGGAGAPDVAIAIAMPLALGAVALTAGLGVMTFVKAFGVGFLARPRSAGAAAAHEVSGSLLKFLTNGTTTGSVSFPNAEMPRRPGVHRIAHVHRNVPGVLRDINKIVSDLQANIRSQTLATDPEIGYLVMDLDQDVSVEVHQRIAALPTNIRTRII